MKRFIALAFLLVLLLATKALLAQKENNVWVSGRETLLDFNAAAPVVVHRDDNIGFFRTNASICDADGNLLFYSNGYKVYNKNFQLMENGNTLEIGDYEDWGYEELAVGKGGVVVPVPNQPGKYHLFHVDLNYVTTGTLTNILMPTHVYVCLIDMALAGGLGGIVSGQKDLVVIADTMTGTGMNVVKHGNGRDYWLFVHEMNSNRYQRLLIDPQGIHGPYVQDFGDPLLEHNGLGFASLVFNLTGSMVAQLNKDSTSIALYDFDRCTGLFSNYRSFNVSDSLYYVTAGTFSPSGEFFYAAAGPVNYIWQFDVTAPDIFASRQLIAHYTGTMNPFQSNYSEMRLAPDNKIYVEPYDESYSVHVINYPDNAGAACGFVENALQINPPGFVWSSMPNTVNYALGPLNGAGCDTVTSSASLPSPVFTWSVYPNPFVGEFQLSCTGVTTSERSPSDKALLEIHNVLGQSVYATAWSPANGFIHQGVDATSFAPGVYLVTLTVGENRHSKTVVRK